MSVPLTWAAPAAAAQIRPKKFMASSSLVANLDSLMSMDNTQHDLCRYLNIDEKLTGGTSSSAGFPSALASSATFSWSTSLVCCLSFLENHPFFAGAVAITVPFSSLLLAAADMAEDSLVADESYNLKGTEK
jgi:hypothetical protein